MEFGYNYCHVGINWLTTCHNDSTSICKDRKWYSILEVMSELHSIEGVNIRDDFHGFATEFLGLRRNRECIHDVKHLRRRGGDGDDGENDDDDDDDDSDEDDESFWRGPQFYKHSTRNCNEFKIYASFQELYWCN